MTGPTASRARSNAAATLWESGASVTRKAFVTREATSEISRFKVRTICSTVSSVVEIVACNSGLVASGWEPAVSPGACTGCCASSPRGALSCLGDASVRASRRRACSSSISSRCAASAASFSLSAAPCRSSSSRASASVRAQDRSPSAFSVSAAAARLRAFSTSARSWSHSARASATAARSFAFSVRIRRATDVA